MDRYQLAGRELESPLVNAAGSINGVNAEAISREVSDLSQTGIGAITVGSFTVIPQAGNEAKYGSPVYYYDEQSARTYNSMGLPNIGIAAAAGLVPEIVGRAHDAGKIIILSGSPTNAPAEYGTPIDQATHLAYELLASEADLVEINVSCPNVVAEGGGRKPILGYDPESMEELVARLGAEIGKTGRLGIKLPPYLADMDREVAAELAQWLKSDGVFDFVVTANTIPNQVVRDEQGRPILTVPGGLGGMSGPATKDIGRQQLELWRRLTDLDIVSTLGVDSGKELDTRLRMGAAAAGGVTFLWQSANPKATVTKMLSEFAELQ